ncbi:MAG: sugar phosphate isomerase/epimerase family protein [Candidatus Fimadaptatus sp.]
MKFSIFTVMAPAWSPEEVGAKLRQYGYDGIEWRVNTVPKAAPDPMPERSQLFWQYNRATINIDDLEADAARAARICEENGLEKLSLASYLKPSELDKIEPLLAAASANGFKMIRLFPDGYRGESPYREVFAQARANLFTVERLCRQYGVQANLEIHMNTIIPSASAAYRLIEGMDEDLIGVVFDAGNMVYEGYENYRIGMDLLGRHVHHVHIKDSTWAPDKDGKLAPGFAEIGSGVVKFDKLFEALRGIGYEGYLSFEDFSVAKPDEDKLRDNLAFIKGVLG